MARRSTKPVIDDDDAPPPKAHATAAPVAPTATDTPTPVVIKSVNALNNWSLEFKLSDGTKRRCTTGDTRERDAFVRSATTVGIASVAPRWDRHITMVTTDGVALQCAMAERGDRETLIAAIRNGLR